MHYLFFVIQKINNANFSRISSNLLGVWPNNTYGSTRIQPTTQIALSSSSFGDNEHLHLFDHFMYLWDAPPWDAPHSERETPSGGGLLLKEHNLFSYCI